MVGQGEFTGQWLGEFLQSLTNEPEQLKSAGEIAKKLGRPQAAEAIVDELEKLMDR